MPHQRAYLRRRARLHRNALTSNALEWHSAARLADTRADECGRRFSELASSAPIARGARRAAAVFLDTLCTLWKKLTQGEREHLRISKEFTG